MPSRRDLLGVTFLALCLHGATAAAAGSDCTVARPELAHGFSLTGWFDGPVARPPEIAGLKMLHDRGMGHVRLPILAESVMSRFTSAPAIEERRRDVAAGLDRLTGLGYGVVVDLHGGDRLAELFGRDPAAARTAVIEAWTVLGPMVEERAGRGVYAEILNEPPVDDATWSSLQSDIVAAIRPVLPTTTLIVSTGGPQRVEHLTAATPIADPNTVYAVHYYDPMVFTHQGADWIRPDPIGWLHDIPFPIVHDDPRLAAAARTLRAAGLDRVAARLDDLGDFAFGPADVRRDMNELAAWSRRHGRAVVLGEFGVYRDHVAPAFRRAWLTAVTAAATEVCIGWTHWEYRDGFGLADAAGRPDLGTLSALVGLGRPRPAPQVP